ncbi:MAG TPA: hypothetical protein VFX59_00120 [Polyangiales bacterium]|nr:hypothetical protein [Polyangiales bacterium]
MPEKKTIERAKRDRRQGKAPSTQAGEFVREEIDHIREGKHGARNAKQAIAIGLSKARRAGVDLPAPKRASKATKKQAARDAARSPRTKVSRTRSRAATKALKRESTSAASPGAIGRQTKRAAKRRTASERSTAAKKAVRTKGPAKRKAAARKAARTRARQ